MLYMIYGHHSMSYYSTARQVGLNKNVPLNTGIIYESQSAVRDHWRYEPTDLRTYHRTQPEISGIKQRFCIPRKQLEVAL